MKKNHEEKHKDDRRGRFISKRAPHGQHVKMLKQMKTPPAHGREERTYPMFVGQEGDEERFGDLIFYAYDKAEMRK